MIFESESPSAYLRGAAMGLSMALHTPVTYWLEMPLWELAAYKGDLERALKEAGE